MADLTYTKHMGNMHLGKATENQFLASTNTQLLIKMLIVGARAVPSDESMSPAGNSIYGSYFARVCLGSRTSVAFLDLLHLHVSFFLTSKNCLISETIPRTMTPGMV